MKNAVAPILTLILIGFAIAGCGALSSQTYCLEEQEKNNIDYMVVTDKSVCDERDDDVEFYRTSDHLNYGDVAYAEYDSDHSKKKEKKKEQVKVAPNVPKYTPPPGPRFTVPAAKPPAQPKVNPPANNTPRVQSNNSGSISRGSSNAGSVSAGRK